MNFKSQFESLTGDVPYQWQADLFSCFMRGKIPSNLSLPTGSGKTNVIVCWLLALSENPALPRRLVYVVDRRSVVDQSTKIVEDIAARLLVDSPASNTIRNALLRISGGEEALGISTLRGEYQDNQEWSKFPYRPAVVCGTVDMVGSRLLFRGYGDRAYSRSLHAGLLGNDTLVVFDECHLVPQFENALRLVQEAGEKLKPFHYMVMSATSSDEGSIQISDADVNNETLGKRLRAVKTLHVVNTEKPVLEQVKLVAQSEPPQRTIVFVRSPQDVAKTAASLRKRYEHVVTLTGTMRGKERDELVDNPVFQAFTTEQEPAEPHFLVATSAGEVGIDLTCTRMVTDMSSAASLVQRFGRCNRFAETKGQIHLVYNDGRLSQKDRVVLTFLKGLRGDVSCLNLWNHREELVKLADQTVAVQALPAHVLNVLSMTSLRNDIDISLYLRGLEQESRYVEIAWRREVGLLADMNDSDFESYMKHMRVLSFEKLSETPKRTVEVVDEILAKQGDATVVVIERDGTRLVTTLSKLHQVDLRECMLIMPSDRGGLSGCMFSAENSDGAALDVAELAHKHYKARVRHIVSAGKEITVQRGWKVAFETEVSGTYIMVAKEKEKANVNPVLLSDHRHAVAEAARKFAELAGLDAEIVQAVESAGLHHDDGKANPVWQLAAKGGSVEKPLAKTSRLNGWGLAGYRHEFGSLNGVKEELEQHLIAAHHAGARPTWSGNKRLSPINQNPDMVLEQVQRFANLQKKFGWWGLAYLESIVRAADAYISNEEAQ